MEPVHMMLTLLGVLFLASTAVSQNATKCFECLDLLHPAYCNKVTTCGHDQMCVVEQLISSSGRVLFNSGCQSRQRCSARGSRDVPRRSSLSRRSDILVCDECCYDNFCNYHGCGKAAFTQPQRGPMCFQCPLLEDPTTCITLGPCRVGEICMLTELDMTTPTGAPLYKSECVSPNACHPTLALMGKKKRDNLCHTCCHDDFCNDHCEAFVNPTTPQTTTTQQTTTPTPKPTTPTPTTTTLATTTTHKPTTTPTTTTEQTTPATTTTTTHKATTTQSPLHKCQRHHGYHYASSHNTHICYRFHHVFLKSWHDANAFCHTEGGHLAIVDSEAKWDLLKNRMSRDHNQLSLIWITETMYWPTDHFERQSMTSSYINLRLSDFISVSQMSNPTCTA